MIYFRVAIRVEETLRWQWQSTALSSLQAVTGFLRMYERVAKERVRIFFSSSPDLLKEMLQYENAGFVSNSMTAEQFYQAKGKIDTLEMVRLEVEVKRCRTRELANRSVTTGHAVQESKSDALYSGAVTNWNEGSYDTPYEFTLPTATQEVLIWARLLTKVQHGVLVP